MSRAAAIEKCKPPKSWRGEYLYKYGRIDTAQRLGWLEQIVLRHQLYIPKPPELNDPKEARPEIAPASIGEFIKTLHKYYVKANPGMPPAEQAHHYRVIEHIPGCYQFDPRLL